jgi:valyl-tRNA synthetase
MMKSCTISPRVVGLSGLPSKVWSRQFSVKPQFQNELNEKYFKYTQVEKDTYAWWESKGYFQPHSDATKKFVLPMPPPNVTGYLHMGHAIFVALQDIMARFYRMKGYSTLWIPGT